ncbi:hypothetical protein PR048_024708 [Dryococelus australis]|uniref:Integrase catalytic domain-containing protein n=1 Tax=Dryococelus australis TaxID=614101 RepID=A0ABQ9GPA9_9NEOP|nr:hypothetical protein PR048_024708 [Dryococelus australis]
MKARHIVKALVDKVWKFFEASEQIVSDNASYFNYRKMKDLCFDNDHRNWDMNLPDLSLAFNSDTHNATGFTPSKVFLGRELSSPLLNVGGGGGNSI